MKKDQSNRIFGALFSSLRDAFSDIRHKLIDEGWFGRRSPNSDSAPSAEAAYRPISDRAVSFEELYGARETPAAQHSGHAREQAERSHSIDR